MMATTAVRQAPRAHRMPKKAVIQIVAAVVSPCILPLLLAIKNDAGPKKADADDDTLNDPGDLRLRILRDR